MFIISAKRNQFAQKNNNFNKAPIRQFAVAMTTNSAFLRLYTDSPLWYQQINRRQIRLLQGDQLIVDFDAADNCRLHVTTMKTLILQDAIPSIPTKIFKDD